MYSEPPAFNNPTSQADAGRLPEESSVTDAERVLHALLHDLRTPIGVAQGYLRLVQNGRITGMERERALAQALQALAETTRLCDSASDFLETAGSTPTVTRVSAASFATSVEARARSRGLAVVPSRIRPEASLTVAGNVSSVCEAIVTVLGGRSASRSTAALHMRAEADQLTFVAAHGDQAPAIGAAQPAPVERWWANGLASAVACRRIVRASGMILSPESADRVLMVAFPLENQPV
jgi:hypothetical protein